MCRLLKTQVLFGLIAIAASKDLLADRKYCGYQHSDDYYRSNKSISIDEFPWLAQLIYDEGIIHCTGSLINNRYILTSAHCLKSARVELKKVRLGDYNVKTVRDCVPVLDDDEDCSEPYKDFELEGTIVHPAFNPRTGLHDIGLIRLSRTVIYSDFIRPICLPRESTVELRNRTSLITSGWGQLGYNEEPTELKKKVSTEIITYEECIKIYGFNKHLLTNEHLCVNETQSITCHGDDGAPLMRSSHNQWEQVGILVTGSRICNPNFSIFNKVASYVDWIKAMLQP
ncbi:hypothetical protein FQR65_LT10109 [Abscondita terminalis]|nr:hypothetical protein FQR65_LT10109 [Abscondita terminalis]